MLGHSPERAASHSQTGETTKVGIDCGKGTGNKGRSRIIPRTPSIASYGLQQVRGTSLKFRFRRPPVTMCRKIIATTMIDTGTVHGVRFAVAAAAALLFAVLAHDVVTHGPLSAHDVAVVAWSSAHRSAALDTWMTRASLSGGPSSTSVYATMLIIACVVGRRMAAGMTIGLIVYGGALLNVAVKHLVQRARPVVDDPLVTLLTYSFPSGHAAASVEFGGLICLLAWRSGFRGTRGAIVIACAVAWVMLVCLSRIYLGLHYPTDVLAGAAEALLWLTGWMAVVDRLGINLGWHCRFNSSP
ncbi:MAG: phosphatase PAP2 family protein [Casimicrobiaceae bacterium]